MSLEMNIEVPFVKIKKITLGAANYYSTGGRSSTSGVAKVSHPALSVKLDLSVVEGLYPWIDERPPEEKVNIGIFKNVLGSNKSLKDYIRIAVIQSTDSSVSYKLGHYSDVFRFLTLGVNYFYRQLALINVKEQNRITHRDYRLANLDFLQDFREDTTSMINMEYKRLHQ